MSLLDSRQKMLAIADHPDSRIKGRGCVRFRIRMMILLSELRDELELQLTSKKRDFKKGSRRETE